jgi:hypothetical protein
MFHVFMLLRIVCKLRHRQESAPIVLSSDDKLAKVIFYPSVHALCLSIGARVESGADVLLYTCCFAYCFSEVTCESWISI